MSSKDEEKTRKLVGMLIEVLHGEYSDTRDLAVVQLAVLGQKAVPYICSYLKEEGELEKDLIEYHKMCWEWRRGPQTVGPVDRDSFLPYGKDELESVKTHESIVRFADEFEKKWGCPPDENGEIDTPGLSNRAEAVNGALEALAIMGDSKAIPTLQKLPIYNYHHETRTGDETPGGRAPLFEKVKETIEKIQSNPS